IPPAARVAGGLAAERVRDPSDELPGPVQEQAAARRRARSLERVPDLRLGRRADPRHLAETAGRRSLAQLLGGADTERAPEVGHALRPEAGQAPEPDELGLHLALELVDLGQAARLDELAQPQLDCGPDPPQLPHAAVPDELADGCGRRADQ